MVVLDNRSTASTGYQPHPGIAKDALGREAAALSIEGIARACGVKNVFSVDSESPNANLLEVFKNSLRTRELTLVLVRTKSVKGD
jgi:indolepyruvate ferredoxin oxidoreductase alpha subunit